jgi:tetratricopeptide (TPR) repeat protein
VLVALGRPGEAIAWFERVGAAAPEDLHAWAEAYLMRQQYSLAHPLLERVLQLEPNNRDALYEITACRTRLGLYDQAMESARRFAQLPGCEARGYVFLGTLQSDLGNYQEAADSYAQVLKFDPEVKDLQVPGYDFLIQYGRTLLRAGRAAQALAPLEQSISLQPSAEAYALLGEARAQLGETSAAAEAWRAAVSLESQHRAAREALANAELSQGRGEEALKWLAPLETGPPLNASTAYLFQRAYTLLKNEEAARQWTERTEKLRRAESLQSAVANLLTVSPQSFWARVIRARQFAVDGNYPQAEAMVEPLLKQAPNEPFVAALAEAVRNRSEPPSLEQIPLGKN